MAKTADVSLYLPKVLCEIYEISLLLKLYNEELSLLWQGCEDALSDRFLSSLTENGLKRFEKLLNLKKSSDLSINERRFRIKSELCSRLPFTLRVLTKQLNALCGAGNYEILVDYEGKKVSVYIAEIAKSNIEATKNMLFKMLPANLIIEVSLLYRQNKMLNSFTHKKLSEYQHNYIREGGEIL